MTIDQITQLESDRYGAIVHANWDRFEELCHDDLRYTHATGVVDTRDSYLTKLRAGHYDYHSIDHPIESIWATPEFALVWGRMVARLRAGTVEKTIDNLTLSAWVRTDAGWRLIAQQPTPAGGRTPPS
ncbi:nuclear transport factor 2 family protein [Rhodococcus opacus]|uniref:nuclear transport factor 2 family protein n=1 Tax=Rhodococcus opacus TaxID=37919 RepID=UPI001C47CDB0|nr:nuclear transport factor 2 family protein [Rhodococcus opacus]MBV6759179.1 nuclear transport factor 2 family protein [Rhodococcus opacus]